MFLQSGGKDYASDILQVQTAIVVVVVWFLVVLGLFGCLFCSGDVHDAFPCQCVYTRKT